MTKIIAVIGATGSQGGGVVNIMTKTPGWKVRGITRNPDSDAAKSLAARGVEVIRANLDNEDSLIHAFKGVHAIFAVTNFWEHLFFPSTQEQSAELEAGQGITLANAAAQTPTLEHYIWSTTPSATHISNGKHPVPHFDGKANVNAYIKNDLPELAKKTTYMYVGYYPQNMVFNPPLTPIEYPGLGKYVQIMATDPGAKILVAGSMRVNPGIWVRQILAKGSVAFGKCCNVALEKWTFQQMLDVWSEVTGKPAVFVQTTKKIFTELAGTAGTELAQQFELGGVMDIWAETEDYISPEELGIDPGEVVGFRGAIEELKEFWQ